MVADGKAALPMRQHHSALHPHRNGLALDTLAALATGRATAQELGLQLSNPMTVKPTT